MQTPFLAVYDDLKDGAAATAVAKDSSGRGALVVSEVAFAYVLLVGAGLLIQSIIRVLDVDLGFQPDRVAALKIDPSNGFRPGKKTRLL